MIKKITLALLLMTTVVNADLFDKGRVSVGIVAGSSYSYGEQYSILGIGVNYFLANGLSVGVGYRGWFGGDPSIDQLTFTGSYYMPLSKKFRPYISGFVRETFVDYDYIANSSYESYGARGGLAMNISKNSYMSLGYVYEEYGDCTETIYRECSSSYPELVFSLAF